MAGDEKADALLSSSSHTSERPPASDSSPSSQNQRTAAQPTSPLRQTQMATLFCPSCSNILVISSETGFNKWACNTCPYEFPITKQMTSRTRLERKQVDDVLGGEEMWKHADSIAGEAFQVPPRLYLEIY